MSAVVDDVAGVDGGGALRAPVGELSGPTTATTSYAFSTAILKLPSARCATDHHQWWTVDPTPDHQDADHNDPEECGCYQLDGVQRETSISAVTTALIARGCHALAHRDQLADQITAPPIQEWPGLLQRHAQAELVHASRSSTEQRGHLTSFLGLHTTADPADRPGPDRLANPDPDQLNEVMTAINDVLLRDLAWSTMTADNAHRHANLWADAIRTTHPTYSTPALALHGFASWLTGDGTAANISADRLRSHHPDYTMGHLLEEILHEPSRPPSGRTSSAHNSAPNWPYRTPDPRERRDARRYWARILLCP